MKILQTFLPFLLFTTSFARDDITAIAEQPDDSTNLAAAAAVAAVAPPAVEELPADPGTSAAVPEPSSNSNPDDVAAVTEVAAASPSAPAALTALVPDDDVFGNAAAPMPLSLRGSAKLGNEDLADERKAEVAESYLQNRLDKVSAEASFLRQQLVEALRAGTRLKGELTKTRQTLENTEQERTQDISKEETVQEQLSNVTEALNEKSRVASELQQELATSSQKEQVSQKSLEEAEENARRDQQQVQQDQGELQKLRSSKASEMDVLNRMKAQYERGLATMAEQLRGARDGEHRLHDALAKEVQHEQLLDGALKNASRIAFARGRALLRVRHQLGALNHSFEGTERSFAATAAQIRRVESGSSDQVAVADVTSASAAAERAPSDSINEAIQNEILKATRAHVPTELDFKSSKTASASAQVVAHSQQHADGEVAFEQQKTEEESQQLVSAQAQDQAKKTIDKLEAQYATIKSSLSSKEAPTKAPVLDTAQQDQVAAAIALLSQDPPEESL